MLGKPAKSLAEEALVVWRAHEHGARACARHLLRPLDGYCTHICILHIHKREFKGPSVACAVDGFVEMCLHLSVSLLALSPPPRPHTQYLAAHTQHTAAFLLTIS